MTLYIGTSGFSYDDWIGEFYPPDLERREWLRFYSKHFNTTELNVTFYRTPFEGMFKSWYSKTPDKFLFSVKGSRFITHIKRLKDVNESLDYFFSKVNLLKEKLGVVLWQLPPGLKPDVKTFSDFLKNLKRYNHTKHAFEFRNEFWLDKKVITMIKDSGHTVCISDYHGFETGYIPGFEFYYIRRHGPKRSGLYTGCYTKSEIKKDGDLIKKIKGKDVFVYFNNDVAGHALKNAKELIALLKPP